jgi:hypothetical protein
VANLSATGVDVEMTNSSAALFGVEVGNLRCASVGHFSANVFGAELANVSAR